MDSTSVGTLIVLGLLYMAYFILYTYVFKTWNFFSKRGVPFDRGVPILGSFSAAMLKREPLATTVQRLYKRYSNHKFIGVYQMGGKPIYFVKDPELIKAITIKDFDHFVNHGFQIDEELDPLFGRNLFNMADEKWRDMRSILSPLFTGSKMRGMLALMNETIAEFAADIRDELLAAGDAGKEYRLMPVYSASTTDVIASCAFGLKTNSFRDPSNEFFALGKQVAYAFQSPRLFMSSCFPKLTKYFKISIMAKEKTDFFRDLVNNSLEQRRKHGVVRKDMLHLMLLMREGRLDSIEESHQDQDTGFATVQEMICAKSVSKLKNFTDDDIVAQCLVFFLAGFAGAANTMSFLSYEMALNPDIQERLHAEIARTHAELAGKPVTYEVLQRMKYLDMVVSETLRRWSLNVVMDRHVTKEYVLQDDNGHKVVLRPGDSVWIPNAGIQQDEQFYPEPEKFDPERFAPENVQAIAAGTYMPFGAGPRACIASRFALMHAKAAVYHLLLQFRMERGPNMRVPLKLKHTTGILEPDEDLQVLFKLRERE